jgi:hypothetical protein
MATENENSQEGQKPAKPLTGAAKVAADKAALKKAAATQNPETTPEVKSATEAAKQETPPVAPATPEVNQGQNNTNAPIIQEQQTPPAESKPAPEVETKLANENAPAPKEAAPLTDAQVDLINAANADRLPVKSEPIANPHWENRPKPTPPAAPAAPEANQDSAGETSNVQAPNAAPVNQEEIERIKQQSAAEDLHLERVKKYGENYVVAVKGTGKKAEETIFTQKTWDFLGTDKNGWKRKVIVPKEVENLKK